MQRSTGAVHACTATEARYDGHVQWSSSALLCVVWPYNSGPLTPSKPYAFHGNTVCHSMTPYHMHTLYVTVQLASLMPYLRTLLPSHPSQPVTTQSVLVDGIGKVADVAHTQEGYRLIPYGTRESQWEGALLVIGLLYAAKNYDHVEHRYRAHMHVMSLCNC